MQVLDELIAIGEINTVRRQIDAAAVGKSELKVNRMSMVLRYPGRDIDCVDSLNQSGYCKREGTISWSYLQEGVVLRQEPAKELHLGSDGLVRLFGRCLSDK